MVRLSIYPLEHLTETGSTPSSVLRRVYALPVQSFFPLLLTVLVLRTVPMVLAHKG